MQTNAFASLRNFAAFPIDRAGSRRLQVSLRPNFAAESNRHIYQRNTALAGRPPLAGRGFALLKARCKPIMLIGPSVIRNRWGSISCRGRRKAGAAHRNGVPVHGGGAQRSKHRSRRLSWAMPGEMAARAVAESGMALPGTVDWIKLCCAAAHRRSTDQAPRRTGKGTQSSTELRVHHR